MDLDKIKSKRKTYFNCCFQFRNVNFYHKRNKRAKHLSCNVLVYKTILERMVSLEIKRMATRI